MLFIDVYKADNKIDTSGSTSLGDLDLQRTIDRVATGRLPSLPCGEYLYHLQIMQKSLGFRAAQFYWSVIFNVIIFLTMVTTDTPSYYSI